MNTRTLIGIRKWLSVIGIISIISSLVVFAPMASAYTGADAPAWAKVAVNEACDAGLVDCDIADPKFGEIATRAVGYQMLTKGTGVWSETALSGFTDLKANWYKQAAHTAFTLGWTAGKDGKGKEFMPANPFTRADMSVAVDAVLGLPDAAGTELDGYTDKASVPSYAVDAMKRMVKAKLIGQGENKLLRPKEGVTKVETIVILNAAVNYGADNEVDYLAVAAEKLDVEADVVQEALDTGSNVVDGELVAVEEVVVEGEEEEEEVAEEEEEEEEEVAEEEEEVVVAPAGALTVALSAKNPAATVLADGTAYNKMLVLSLTAGTGTVDVTGFKVHHDGISTDANIAGVLIQDAAGKRYGNVVTFSEKIADLSFPSDPIKVTAGTPVEITVLMHFGVNLASSTVGASITAATDVTSNATSVAGTFPIVGPSMTTVDGGTTIGSLDPDIVNLGNAARSVDIGVKDQEVTRFVLAAGSNEHAFLKKLTVYNNGNAADGDIKNIRLLNLKGGDPLATVEKTVNKYVTFDLSAKPFKIEKGVSETVKIVVDVTSGSSRTVQFRILNDYDLELTGESGSGILAATGGAGTDTAFPIGDSNGDANAATINSLAIGGGTLLTSKDTSSPAGNISQGAKSQVLGIWKLEATGENIEVRKVCFDLDRGVTVANENDAYSGTIKVVRSNGSNVYSFSPATQTDNVDGTCTEVTLSSYFTIKAGESEKISLVSDILSTLASGTALTSEFAVNEYKRVDTNDIVTTGGGDANALGSNALTVLSANLTVVSNPSFQAAQTIVSGGPKTKIGSLVIQNGPAEAVSLQTLSVTLDNDGTRNGDDTDTLVGITNLRVCKGGSNCATADDVYGTTVANPSAAAAGNSFTVSGKLNLDASGSATVDVHADLSSTAPGGNNTVTPYLQIGSITFVGSTSNTSNSSYPTALTSLQTMTITAAGTLTVSAPTQPKQKIIHTGETGTDVLSVQFTSQYEPVVIEKLVVTAVNGGGNIDNLTLKDSANAPIKAGVGLANNRATFAGLNITIPKDTAVTYKIYVDATPSGVMASGQNVELRFGSVDARGANSNTPLLETSYLTESLPTTTAATSAGHYKRGDVLLKSEAAAGSGTVATDGIVTANVEEDVNLQSTTSFAGLGTRSNANNDVIAKITPTATGTTTTATNVSSIAMVLGDVIMVGLDNAAYGWGIITTASNAGAQPTAGLAGAAPAALTIATSGTISKFTPTATSAVAAANPPTLTQGMTFVVGDVVFAPTALNAATHGWQVVTVAETIGIGAATAGAVRLNGAATIIAGNVSVASRISKFTPITTETVTTVNTTTASNSYNTGDIVYVYDGNVDVDDGLFVVQTPLQAGAVWTATSLGVGITLTNSSVISKVFSSTSAPKSNIVAVHDVEPVVAKSATALGTSQVLESMQDIAIFDVTASGTRNLFISRVDLLCTGGGSTNTELNDNALEIKVDGSVVASSTTQAENAAGCDSGTAANGRPYGFISPVEIPAGTTKSFLVRFDTSATAGQWSTGETLLMRINGTEGRSGGGMQWYYTSAAASQPATIPTLASPATVLDNYPVDGPTLTK